MTQRIYLDHSATTPLDSRVLAAMMPYLTDDFGNANSVHAFGQRAAYAVDTARRTVAQLLGVDHHEIYFVSGGTEADNWALRGCPRSPERNQIIISAVEHAAIMGAAAQLSASGVEVLTLPVDSDGLVSPQSLRDVITNRTALVSVMLANNEVGTIQPIAELATIAHEHGALFHTDAVQAIGSIPVAPRQLGVDMLSLSAHKFYGPKGIGALYVRRGLKLGRLIAGGHQERTMRGGTTNVPAAVGLATALQLAVDELEATATHVASVRDCFVQRVEQTIDHIRYVGHRTKRLPQNANFIFDFIEGESLLLTLDLAGVSCSSGSACSSGSLEPSHVLLAMGIPHELAHGSLRFSFGRANTIDQVDATVSVLASAVAKLRQMSPLSPTNQ